MEVGRLLASEKNGRTAGAVTLPGERMGSGVGGRAGVSL